MEKAGDAAGDLRIAIADDVTAAIDSAAARSYHPGMPLWHCPHCGTPQAEAARCWVCRKSSTTCAACRHFRRGVVASLGYCGLDRRHMPLRGDDIRSCWEGAARHVPSLTPGSAEQAAALPSVEAIVPVELTPRTGIEGFWADSDL